MFRARAVRLAQTRRDRGALSLGGGTADIECCQPPRFGGCGSRWCGSAVGQSHRRPPGIDFGNLTGRCGCLNLHPAGCGDAQSEDRTPAMTSVRLGAQVVPRWGPRHSSTQSSPSQVSYRSVSDFARESARLKSRTGCGPQGGLLSLPLRRACELPGNPPRPGYGVAAGRRIQPRMTNWCAARPSRTLDGRGLEPPRCTCIEGNRSHARAWLRSLDSSREPSRPIK